MLHAVCITNALAPQFYFIHSSWIYLVLYIIFEYSNMIIIPIHGSCHAILCSSMHIHESPKPQTLPHRSKHFNIPFRVMYERAYTIFQYMESGITGEAQQRTKARAAPQTKLKTYTHTHEYRRKQGINGMEGKWKKSVSQAHDQGQIYNFLAVSSSVVLRSSIWNSAQHNGFAMAVEKIYRI